MDFDPQHYVTPRRDTTPGYLHTAEPLRMNALEWAIVSMIFGFLFGLLYFTDCGAMWCW